MDFNKVVKNIPLITGSAMIVFGSASEIFYYAARYIAEGEPVWFSVVKGAALTLFLLVVSTKTNKLHYLALCSVLVTYSIFCTSAGQATQYAARYNAKQTAASLDDRTAADLETRKTEITGEIATIKKAKSEKEKERDSIPLDDRMIWTIAGYDNSGKAQYQKTESTVFRTVNEEIEKYEARLSVLESELSEIGTIRVTIRDKQDDPYYIISDITKIPASIVQYILQSLYSLFTAVMAPIGLGMILAFRAGLRESVETAEKPGTRWPPISSVRPPPTIRRCGGGGVAKYSA